jgi:hypothetical protein
VLCVQLSIEVFTGWIDREYKYNLASDTVSHWWKYWWFVHYTRVYQWAVSIGIFKWQWELFTFSLALFMVFIIHRYTNGHNSSVYSRGDENCSPSPWHYSRCSLHTGIPPECFHRYILETMKIVPLHPSIVLGIHYTRVYR